MLVAQWQQQAMPNMERIGDSLVGTTVVYFNDCAITGLASLVNAWCTLKLIVKVELSFRRKGSKLIEYLKMCRLTLMTFARTLALVSLKFSARPCQNSTNQFPVNNTQLKSP